MGIGQLSVNQGGEVATAKSPDKHQVRVRGEGHLRS